MKNKETAGGKPPKNFFDGAPRVTGRDVTDLLTPGQVMNWGYHRPVPAHERTPEERLLHRLSRDYLTLWERNKKLEQDVAELLEAMDIDVS